METSDSVTVVLATGQAVLTIFGAFVGWFVRSLFFSINELKAADRELAREVTSHRVSLPERYVSKEDFKHLGDNIFGTLRRIEDKIDRKVDKA